MTPSINSLSISNMYQEAWQRIYGLKADIFKILVVYIAICFIFNFLLRVQNSALNFFATTVVQFAVWFIFTLMLTLAYQQVTSSKPDIKLAINSNLPLIGRIAGLGLIYLLTISLITFITSFIVVFLSVTVSASLAFVVATPLGVLLFYLMCIILVFALPLVVFKHTDIRTALQLGFQATNHNFIKLFLTGCVSFLAALVGVVTLGVGFIWVLPLMWVVNVIWFREVFGLN